MRITGKSEKIADVLARIRHRLPGWAALFVLLPLGCFVFWVAKAGPLPTITSGWLFRHILSGDLFTKPLPEGCISLALDQDTIGKWMFWFSMTATMSVTAILTVRWLVKRDTWLRNWAFAVPVVVICLLLLIILTLPTAILVQYISSAGFAPGRGLGLLLCVMSWGLLPWFAVWAIRRGENWPRYRIAILLATVLAYILWLLGLDPIWRPWRLILALTDFNRHDFPILWMIMLVIAYASLLMLLLLCPARRKKQECA